MAVTVDARGNVKHGWLNCFGRLLALSSNSPVEWPRTVQCRWRDCSPAAVFLVMLKSLVTRQSMAGQSGGPNPTSRSYHRYSGLRATITNGSWRTDYGVPMGTDPLTSSS
ncbi:hypothetical protein CDAR_202261 [Caerostris darwini]|uniref:Uncharacterized protein n=1 Tax=Caerostris darwini TaxID=1538125 RepID=A0AAV4QZL6_9ARAC|nr:hypothetical protein CDAR_202261 [Caerostris darwini]